MEKILETKFVDVYFHKEKSRMDNHWKSSTEYMEIDEYKTIVLDIAEKVKKFEPKYMLSDTTTYAFVVTPDLQLWVSENFFVPVIEAGLEKLAFLVSKNVFTKVSVEQMMEEKEASKMTTQYFDNKEVALKWLEE